MIASSSRSNSIESVTIVACKVNKTSRRLFQKNGGTEAFEENFVRPVFLGALTNANFAIILLYREKKNFAIKSLDIIYKGNISLTAKFSLCI